MPYVGGKLEHLFVTSPAQAALLRMAGTGGDELHDLVVRNTPIDTGNLRTSWYRMALKRTRRTFMVGWEARVATDVKYAPYVEHGTGLYGPMHRKYLIEPKKLGGVLAFSPRSGGFNSVQSPETGGTVFVTHVWHPGSPGAHMIANAVARLEATYGVVLKPDAVKWAREQESVGQARAMAGVVLPT